MTDKQKQAMSILYRLAQEKCITEEEHIILSEVITEQQQPNVWREITFPQTLGPYYDYNGIFGPVTCTTNPTITSWASTTIDNCYELNETDERREIFEKQRQERGFDDSELWNLDTTILKFILPRLKAFKEIAVGTPSDFESFEEWEECLDKMIKSIESIIDDGDNIDYEGFELFKKYFFNLWW